MHAEFKKGMMVGLTVALFASFVFVFVSQFQSQWFFLSNTQQQQPLTPLTSKLKIGDFHFVVPVHDYMEFAFFADAVAFQIPPNNIDFLHATPPVDPSSSADVVVKKLRTAWFGGKDSETDWNVVVVPGIEWGARSVSLWKKMEAYYLWASSTSRFTNNTTNVRRKWVVKMDTDTVIVVAELMRLLEQYDEAMAHLMGDRWAKQTEPVPFICGGTIIMSAPAFRLMATELLDIKTHNPKLYESAPLITEDVMTAWLLARQHVNATNLSPFVSDERPALTLAKLLKQHPKGGPVVAFHQIKSVEYLQDIYALIHLFQLSTNH